ncbi:MAG: hypothetical protein HeimC2_04690 [Candidatus Heimdallarchaeota archaeon LC_2]|nr:MAG: hypothetical protein HeimC2_04690 [Candidatus Heimdallarchaeota archaeon LC_2]
MYEVIKIIDGLYNIESVIVPDDVVKGPKEECEGYLEKYPLPEVNKFVALSEDLEKVVSNFECEEQEDGQYQLQLKIDDEWHYSPEEVDSDSLHSKDEVIHIIDLLLRGIKSEDTATNDIVSSLIDYFIETDITEYEIIPVGTMDKIERILNELKVELLNIMDEN